MGEAGEITITRLGAHGDGVALVQGAPLYVPGALPGETWSTDGSQPSLCAGTRSSERVEPVCAHFAECGGCVAQHMSAQLYATWKRDLLVQAFAHRGLSITPENLESVGCGQRRRTTFSFAQDGAGFRFGYHRPASRQLVDVAECPVLQPEINSRLSELRSLAERICTHAKAGQMHVTVLNDGLDVVVDVQNLKLDANTRPTLSAAAQEADALRLIINDDPIIDPGHAVLTVNGATLNLAPNLFLQASAQAEALMVRRAVQSLGRAKNVADLFCGVGTFTFPCAKVAKVAAYDGDASAISCLKDAISRNQGYKPIKTMQRDLFREPLSVRELRNFDAVIINPPRSGAAEQCQRLAKSSVNTIVMIACSPATLSRDARTLIDGGYQLESVLPVDQFVFSAHLEAVAVFQREKSARKRSI